ncbi:hypothetical protein QLX08_009562 [Tetragonisca angustula]|uniref:Uncharacterized protein n=1 Tax=Tetragonisca angustula TaxID=166442 RepID=A0AAW0ZG97_9HYME
MMDRRLSNVQLQQRLYESETVCQQRYEDGSPRQSIVDQTAVSPSTPSPGPPVSFPPPPPPSSLPHHHHHHHHRHHHYHHRHQQQQQQQQQQRPSIVQQPKSARSSVGRSDSGSDRGNDRYTGYYLGAAKMATRRGEPL